MPSMVERYGFVLVSALAHVAAFALLIPQISYRPIQSEPMTIDFVIEAPKPPPEPEPEPEPLEPERPQLEEVFVPEPQPEVPPITDPAPPPERPPATPAAPSIPSPTPRQTRDPARPPTASSSKSPSPAHVQAVRSVLCLRLKGRERLAYKCDERPSTAPQTVTVAQPQEAQRVRAQHVTALSATNRKDSYVEQLMARNAEIPATLPGGIDNTIFQETDGRDENARRIRMGERPSWENEFRRALDED